MPVLEVNGARLHFEVSGIGPETVVFAHGLLWDGRMFEPQVAALDDRYRCITVDFRGQGQSEVTAGGYDMDNLTDDLAGLIETFKCAPCHFVGLSMGGFVGIRLAARRPELVRSLTLIATSADAEPRASRRRARWLAVAARWLGPRVVVRPAMATLFGDDLLADPGRREDRAAYRQRLLGIDRRGMSRALAGVLGREPVLAELRSIRCPVLILHGDQDKAIPREYAQRMHARMRDSRMELIPGAGHTPTLEQAQVVATHVRDFIGRN